MKPLAWIVAVFAGFIAVIVLVTALTLGYRWLVAAPEGATEAREQTVGEGTFRIAAYDHFFNLCAAIQADEGRLSALESELTTGPSGERVEQINASMTAVRASREQKIRRYNTDAAKDYTIGQFRDSDLPYQLDIEGSTTCVV